MIRAVWFDIGGTVHTQDATPENDTAYANRLFYFLSLHGIKTASTPAELLPHIDQGAKAYKIFSEKEMIELPCDEIWHNFMLKDFPLPANALHGLGEDLSYMYDRWRKVITRRAGLEETLQALTQSGYHIGVISNIMSKTFVPRILDEYGISHYFEHLILSSEYMIRKPRRELFDAAREKMGLPTNEVAYIGDTISRDVLGTRAAEWQLMIQIENPRISQKDEKYKNCGYEPDYRIKSLLEIPSIIEGFNARLKEGGTCS